MDQQRSVLTWGLGTLGTVGIVILRSVGRLGVSPQLPSLTIWGFPVPSLFDLLVSASVSVCLWGVSRTVPSTVINRNNTFDPQANKK